MRLAIRGLKVKLAPTATLWRVDADNANAFAAWKKMGSPQSPNFTQYQELERASELVPQTLPLPARRGGTIDIDVRIPRQGVALIVFNVP